MSNEELKVGEVLNLSGLLKHCEDSDLVISNDSRTNSGLLLRDNDYDGEIMVELDWSINRGKLIFTVRYVL